MLDPRVYDVSAARHSFEQNVGVHVRMEPREIARKIVSPLGNLIRNTLSEFSKLQGPIDVCDSIV